MPTRRLARALVVLALAGPLAVLAGCARHAPPLRRLSWCFGAEPGDLRPDGRPDPYTVTLRRLLYRGLVDQDSSGRIVPAAAERWEASADSLEWTFHLRSGLRFADGEPCGSEDFRRAMLRALQGPAAGSATWMLWNVAGVERFRGRPGDLLTGASAPDPRTLVLRLTRRDSRLLDKLAHPLCATPVSPRPGPPDSLPAAGLGPYRVAKSVPGRSLLLVRSSSGVSRALFDTLEIEFRTSVRLMRAALRAERYQLIWPVPAGLVSEASPEGYATLRAEARPPLWLVMALRCDLPPTSRPAARRALASGLNRPALVRGLGIQAAGGGVGWLDPRRPLALPPHDQEQVQALMADAHLGRSFHVQLGFARGGPGEQLARDVQQEWAGQSIDAELRPMGPEALAQALGGGGPHVTLAEDQSLVDDPRARLAQLLRPPRGGAIGGYRVSWMPRALDAAVWPRRPSSSLDLDAAARAIEDDLPLVPLARLPYLALARAGAPPVSFHPRFGLLLDLPETIAGRNVKRDRR